MGRILIAEADPAMRGVMARQLRARGHACDAVARAPEVLAAVLCGRHDLAILGSLPEGYELDRLIVHLRRLTHDLTPILCCVRGQPPDWPCDVRAAGAFETISMPCENPDLVARVDASLRERSLRLACSDATGAPPWALLRIDVRTLSVCSEARLGPAAESLIVERGFRSPTAACAYARAFALAERDHLYSWGGATRTGGCISRNHRQVVAATCRWLRRAYGREIAARWRLRWRTVFPVAGDRRW